jgi:hypothetical protein
MCLSPRRTSNLLRPLFFTLLLTAGCRSSVPTTVEAQPAGDRPRLAVLVVFDQMRGDYPERWRDLFVKEGFRRLLDDGAWFQHCHYSYANTVTSAGHASLAAGCPPAVHGIIENDWYDRAAGAMINCVAQERYGRVPAPVARPGETIKPRDLLGSAPDRLLAPTLGDALKDATAGKGKVVALSFKDRSAVLPAGRRPDACYWLDGRSGLFITSTYYRDQPHPWVNTFNRKGLADQWFDRKWELLRPDLDYLRLSNALETSGPGGSSPLGRFPHALAGKEEKPGKEYYDALFRSPFGNDVLLELAKWAIHFEQLGADDVPDLLCVSFSCNDPVGHLWGPDSPEVLDVTLRSDLIVKDLLAALDEKVGKGRYVLALSSDHGVCPVPEEAAARKLDAGRVPPKLIYEGAEDHLQELFGKQGGPRTRWVDVLEYPWVYLNREAIRQRGLQAEDVERALAVWLAAQPGVQAAYTRAQLSQPAPADDLIGQMVRRSHFPERSGDVTMVLKPYHLMSPYAGGTTHGTPHPYDTHVPLLVYGAGVKGGVRKDAVTPLVAASVLARALKINPPQKAEGVVPEGLFKESKN